MSAEKDQKQQGELVAHSIMAQSELARMQDYLQRGRRYANTGEEALQGIWLQHVRRWAEFVHARPLEMDDADAEFKLRGTSAPYHLAKYELDQIITAITRGYEAMTDEERRKANDDMVADFNRDREQRN